jgi:hypothetical protein
MVLSDLFEVCEKFRLKMTSAPYRRWGVTRHCLPIDEGSGVRECLSGQLPSPFPFPKAERRLSIPLYYGESKGIESDKHLFALQ